MRNNNKKRKVSAIISDYDGTLCPTSCIRAGKGGGSRQDSRIPEELENLLVQVSRQTPVCILSSKDYWFLHDRVPFANIISCILGIETVVVARNETSRTITNIIRTRHLSFEGNDDCKLLKSSERALSHLAEDVASRFPEIEIERKLTLDGFLAGVTFDWRGQKDWTKYSSSLPVYIKDALYERYRSSSTLYLQAYKSHPFVDVYAVECNKGFGFDCIVEELLQHRQGMGDILYLGDSENDNPAFRSASLSVGIVSDSRLSSDLECQFAVHYDQLANFLGLLMDNDFVVSEKVMASMRQT